MSRLAHHSLDTPRVVGTYAGQGTLYGCCNVQYPCAPLVGWSSMTGLVLACLHISFLLLVLLAAIPALGLVVHTPCCVPPCCRAIPPLPVLAPIRRMTPSSAVPVRVLPWPMPPIKAVCGELSTPVPLPWARMGRGVSRARPRCMAASPYS